MVASWDYRLEYKYSIVRVKLFSAGLFVLQVVL